MVDLDSVRREKAPDAKRSQERISPAFMPDDEVGDAGKFELAEEAAFELSVAADIPGTVEEADEKLVTQPHHLLCKILDVDLRPAGGRRGDQVKDSHSYRVVGSGRTERMLASG